MPGSARFSRPLNIIRGFGRAALICAPVMLSCTTSAQTRRPQPFTVSGVVLDSKGKPLEGAKVRLRADFIYGRAEATTGADGRYVISDLIKATYRAEAWIETRYAGARMCQQLAMPKPTDYNSFPVSQGAERNFRWQLTGRIGLTDSYFGAAIRIFGLEIPSRDAARSVEFTLTPTGPLVDGSAGAVIVKEAPLEYPASDDGLYDLPLGTYRLKAVLIGKDGRRTPLTIRTMTSETFLPEVDLVWRAAQLCDAGTDNGVEPFFVQLQPR